MGLASAEAAPVADAAADEETGSLVGIVSKYNGERIGLVLESFASLPWPPARHWYLNAIAARRGQRARGVGARLLEPFLARSDAEGVPIYLESSNPRNLTFYHRYGFEDYAPRVDLPESGPPIQPMSRPAGSTPQAR